MLSNHLMLCRPLPLLPSLFPSISENLYFCLLFVCQWAFLPHFGITQAASTWLGVSYFSNSLSLRLILSPGICGVTFQGSSGSCTIILGSDGGLFLPLLKRDFLFFFPMSPSQVWCVCTSVKNLILLVSKVIILNTILYLMCPLIADILL